MKLPHLATAVYLFYCICAQYLPMFCRFLLTQVIIDRQATLQDRFSDKSPVIPGPLVPGPETTDMVNNLEVRQLFSPSRSVDCAYPVVQEKVVENPGVVRAEYREVRRGVDEVVRHDLGVPLLARGSHDSDIGRGERPKGLGCDGNPPARDEFGVVVDSRDVSSAVL